ncbi:hypothetical protein NEH16_20690 [Streptomyces drozdowiczii]|uniref:Uncharacterized protein n=2 Tax=Streptomyces drozdowiczii TaxID=202862 RepID=A0ABY6Q2Y9_9ACTN|nr:hypothetical protein [Streptomyces drozdowiczii]UZK58736.1 hypothetical protein NEH16_20690 [Streptomyces drozdowiczii]
MVTEVAVPAQGNAQSRRTAVPGPSGAAPAALDAKAGTDVFAAGRPALPGQRSAP